MRLLLMFLLLPTISNAAENIDPKDLINIICYSGERTVYTGTTTKIDVSNKTFYYFRELKTNKQTIVPAALCVVITD